MARPAAGRANLPVALGRLRMILRWLTLAAVACAVTAPSALADDFLPHPDGAQWTYRWSDDKYNPNGTTETVAVDTTDPANCGWQLKWSGDIQVPIGSGSGGGTSPVIDQPDNGTICFQDQSYGLVNTNWSGSSPPLTEPPLCPSTTASGSCANSLGSVMYNVIWGTRSPTLAEPLIQGTSWNSTGRRGRQRHEHQHVPRAADDHRARLPERGHRLGGAVADRAGRHPRRRLWQWHADDLVGPGRRAGEAWSLTTSTAASPRPTCGRPTCSPTRHARTSTTSP